MSSTTLDTDDHRRKRLRKGTNSCWECKLRRVMAWLSSAIITSQPTPGKRRKVRCEVNPHSAAICAGCVSRGTACVSQEYPEEHAASGNTQLGERIGRLEIMLQDLATKFESHRSDMQRSSEIQGSTFGVLTPRSLVSLESYGTHPALSVSDNVVVSNPVHVTSHKLILLARSSRGCKSAESALFQCAR